MDEEKYKSRKYRLAFWTVILGSIIALSQVVGAFFEVEFPSWLGVVASSCIATGTAYIIGNVYQKTHLPGFEEEKKE